ncbi:MAG: hypothetical protein AAGB26_08130 [Planctomycetota bacterium]
MTANEILRRLNEQPFQPFALVTSDGDRHEIRHSENAKLLPGGVLYLFHPTSDKDAQVEYPVSISLLHITTIQPLPHQAA